ncbi:MAG: hypothetical protein AB8I08_37140 [Sandaracinaceae bacterium]
MRANSTIDIGGQTLRVVAGGDLLSGSTLAVEPAGTAQAVTLAFLPRGGRLTVTVDGDERSVYLPDRRCDFVAVLLAPPGEVSAGDFVSDEFVWSRVWGKKPSGKKTLNVLLHRLRRDLDRVGLDGSALVERLAAVARRGSQWPTTPSSASTEPAGGFPGRWARAPGSRRSANAWETLSGRRAFRRHIWRLRLCSGRHDDVETHAAQRNRPLAVHRAGLRGNGVTARPR